MVYGSTDLCPGFSWDKNHTRVLQRDWRKFVRLLRSVPKVKITNKSGKAIFVCDSTMRGIYKVAIVYNHFIKKVSFYGILQLIICLYFFKLDSYSIILKPKEGLSMAKKRLISGKTAAFTGTALILAITTAAVLFIFYLNGAFGDTCIAKVNGEPIQKREFLRQLKLERANTFEYFGQKYNASPSGEFWNKNFNGEVPVEYARGKALEECVSVKVRQVLAREYGLIDDIRNEAFLKELALENKRRKAAVKNSLPVYGPVQYNENGYFTQVLSNLIIKTKDKLLEGELKPTEAELRDHYEKVKDRLYKKEDYIRFNLIYIHYGKDGGAFTEAERNGAMDIMKEIKMRLDRGERLEDVVKIDVQKIKVEEKSIDADSASSYSKSSPKLFEAAKMLGAGQTSEVLDEIIQRRIEIVNVIYKEGTGYKDFDEFKDSVLSNYIDEKYEELVDKLVQEAKVEINESVYKKTYPD